MPYPVETLPYPFKKRLRQLLTPFETLQYQKATGRLEDKRYLLPVQRNEQCLKVFIGLLDNNLTSNWYLDNADQELPIEPGPCIYRPKLVNLSNLLEVHLSNPIFDYVLFDRIDTLTLSDIVITESLLLALASKKLKLTTFKRQFTEPELFSEDAPQLRAYFDAFPTMTECYRPCPAYEGWLQDLIAINKHDLKLFIISSDNYEKLFSFRLEDLLKLLEGQCSEFQMYLDYKVNDVTAVGLDHFSSFKTSITSPEAIKKLNVRVRVYDGNNPYQNFQFIIQWTTLI